MAKCYNTCCMWRNNDGTEPQECAHVACPMRDDGGPGLYCTDRTDASVGVEFHEEEIRSAKEAFEQHRPGHTAHPTGEPQEPHYDPMEYIWKRRKKWAVKFRCNTDGSTIVFGYVCPKCMAESYEPLDKCPKCGADLRGDNA